MSYDFYTSFLIVQIIINNTFIFIIDHYNVLITLLLKLLILLLNKNVLFVY